MPYLCFSNYFLLTKGNRLKSKSSLELILNLNLKIMSKKSKGDYGCFVIMLPVIIWIAFWCIVIVAIFKYVFS